MTCGESGDTSREISIEVASQHHCCIVSSRSRERERASRAWNDTGSEIDGDGKEKGRRKRWSQPGWRVDSSGEWWRGERCGWRRIGFVGNCDGLGICNGRQFSFFLVWKWYFCKWRYVGQSLSETWGTFWYFNNSVRWTSPLYRNTNEVFESATNYKTSSGQRGRWRGKAHQLVIVNKS